MNHWRVDGFAVCFDPDSSDEKPLITCNAWNKARDPLLENFPNS